METYIESAIAVMLPKITVPSGLSLEEEFALFRNRAKPFQVELVDDVLFVYLTYQGLAWILCDRLIANGDCLLHYCDRVFVVFGDREPVQIWLNINAI
ncbi:hypothetical protein [Pseudanabaena sp. 'Roaring Creek']|uniref:hypothetical protein n=1 Tax=Pseudanabaena sp. 'Roaring Creek' TaxID=1681830 RepID=UPI0006D7FCCB|nr:hypothetical protein [Pseudanabaena sp. 'Roaring Creek']